jgi:transposase
MSLPAFSTQSELFSTAGLSGGLFAETDRFRLFAKLVYPRIAQVRSQLAAGYCLDNGRSAIEPVLLLGVSLLQYLEAIPDRQAVDLLRYHVGWNFALNRQVGDELFHPTTLVNFRQRLLEHELSAVAFQTVLDALIQAGLVARQSRQRLDSTQMFGRVSRMSRLDCVRESLELALRELEAVVKPESRPPFWVALWERYVESRVDYRCGSQTLARKLVEAGADAYPLLDWLRSQTQPEWAQGQQVQLLARVFAEQFDVVAGTASPQVKGKEQLDSGRVQNPHDPEATYSTKGKGEARKEHVGYKVQVAESVSEATLPAGQPTRNFITGITTHRAFESDEAGALKMQAEQAEMGLDKPPVQYVDGAYVSGQLLAAAAAEGRELMGPASGAAENGGRFTTEQFVVSVEQRKAVCPAGHTNTQCSRLKEGQSRKVVFRFEWSTLCVACPLRTQCVGPKQKHRTIEVSEHHSALQVRRLEQRTDAFKQRMKHRNGIEGTQSELVRGHGMRRARYRGLAKARLQNYFIGAACNVKRWIRQEVWKLKQAVSAGAAQVANATAG